MRAPVSRGGRRSTPRAGVVTSCRRPTARSMSTVELSPIAAYVFRSLRDHPELRVADAIAAGPAAAGGSPKPRSAADVRSRLQLVEQLGEPALRGAERVG